MVLVPRRELKRFGICATAAKISHVFERTAAKVVWTLTSPAVTILATLG
jgi:hypothetical protein